MELIDLQNTRVRQSAQTFLVNVDIAEVHASNNKLVPKNDNKFDKYSSLE